MLSLDLNHNNFGELSERMIAEISKKILSNQELNKTKPQPNPQPLKANKTEMNLLSR